jgi:hypothetical protein
MRFLNWLMEQQENIPNILKPSNYELLALVLIYSAPTPKLAIELIEKSPKLNAAISFLKENRLIFYSFQDKESGYKCTPRGIYMLKYNGIIRRNRLTGKGKRLVATRSEYL